MNGTEQRARHTAVAAIAKRQDDLEEVLAGLAHVIVEDRAAHVQATQGTRAACDQRQQRQLERDREDQQELRAFKTMTIWQRMRWFVRGQA